MQHTVLSVLGLKGQMSDYELNLFRQRSSEAIREKAGRGELCIPLPVGFCWMDGKIVKDPDQRVQQADATGVSQNGRTRKCASGHALVSTREDFSARARPHQLSENIDRCCLLFSLSGMRTRFLRFVATLCTTSESSASTGICQGAHSKT